MKVRVTKHGEIYRADPTQLSGSPPNGTGRTESEAVQNLLDALYSIDPDGPDRGYIFQMRRFGFPLLEITDATGRRITPARDW